MAHQLPRRKGGTLHTTSLAQNKDQGIRSSWTRLNSQLFSQNSTNTYGKPSKPLETFWKQRVLTSNLQIDFRNLALDNITFAGENDMLHCVRCKTHRQIDQLKYNYDFYACACPGIVSVVVSVCKDCDGQLECDEDPIKIGTGLATPFLKERRRNHNRIHVPDPNKKRWWQRTRSSR
jgi:hypothetical protein